LRIGSNPFRNLSPAPLERMIDVTFDNSQVCCHMIQHEGNAADRRTPNFRGRLFRGNTHLEIAKNVAVIGA
jgi:hypothetical protein